VRHTAENSTKLRSRTEQPNPIVFDVAIEECRVSSEDADVAQIKQRLSKQKSAITLEDIKQKLSRAEAQRAKA